MSVCHHVASDAREFEIAVQPIQMIVAGIDRVNVGMLKPVPYMRDGNNWREQVVTRRLDWPSSL